MCASTVPVESARGNVCLRSKTARDHSSRDLSLSLCLSLSEIYGQRATLSVNYKPGDWDSVRAWILKAGSGWHQAENSRGSAEYEQFRSRVPRSGHSAPQCVCKRFVHWIPLRNRVLSRNIQLYLN